MQFQDYLYTKKQPKGYRGIFGRGGEIGYRMGYCMIPRMTILILLHLQSLWMRNRTKIGVTELGYQGIAMKELDMSIENHKTSPHSPFYIQTKVYSSSVWKTPNTGIVER